MPRKSSPFLSDVTVVAALLFAAAVLLFAVASLLGVPLS